MTTKFLVALLLGFGFVAIIRVAAELIEHCGIWGIAVLLSVVLLVVQL